VDIVQVGIDHHAAPISVRERVAITGDRLPSVLAGLKAEPWLSEVLVVSTCNRTEVYAVSTAPDAGALLLGAVRRFVPGAPDESEGFYVRREGQDAAFHLFRVATGLESAILGETEIQGQVKEAHRAALEVKSAGTILDRLASTALKAGKRARTDTPLCRGAVSHGQAAYEVTRQVFGGLKHRTVLVVGAGEMATRAATAIAALPGGRFLVANRTKEPAEHLAALLPGATVTDLADVPARLAEAHVAIFAGGHDALSRAQCEAAAAKRRDPLLVLDYGVPRCVDPTVVGIPGVFLYDLEAMEKILAKSLASRREALPAAEAILEEEFEGFCGWLRTRRVVPAIRTLQSWAEEIRRSELEHLPADAPEAMRAAVDEMTRRIVDRILRRPTARVREGAELGDPAMPTSDHLRNVFGLLEEGGVAPASLPVARTANAPPMPPPPRETP